VESSQATKSSSWYWVAAAAILLVAAFLRLWQISQVPPGLYSDESYTLLQAEQIAQGGWWPVFITGNNGYEPMIVYLAALCLKLLGPVTWAGRLATAWAGILGVAATIRCGIEMFPGRPTGLLAGAVLAGLFMHVDFSRFGVEPVLAATAAALFTAAFWRALRTGSLWSFAVAGVCLGLGLYTYRAFRLFPLVPLVCFGAVWMAGRTPLALARRLLLKGSILTAGIALVVFAPLGIFFLRNPEWFAVRLQETAIPMQTVASGLRGLVSNAAVTIGGLFLKGDVIWRHNLAGRPALDIFQAVFFMLGVAIMIRQWSKPQTWTLWAWLLVGLLPSVLTIDAPHFGRMLMATPALALVAGLGMEVAWRRLPRRAGPCLVVILLGCSIALTARDYFVVWAARPEVYEMFNAREAWAARALQQAPSGASLYASSFRRPNYQYPEFSTTVDYLIGPEAKRDLRTFYGQTCLVMPSQTKTTTVYAIPAAERATTLQSLVAVFPAADCSLESILDDVPDTYVCQVAAGQTAKVPMAVASAVTFGGFVRLEGYTLSAESLHPGETLQATLLWKAASVSTVPFKAFVHLVGPPKANGSVLYAQEDNQPCAGSYPTWWWRPDELVLDTFPVRLPADMPPGIYTLLAGWYDDATEGGSGARVAAVGSEGQNLGDSAPLQQIQIRNP
jgi:4-amino-4-deoxy-L-arabinose transferase-like glycosyltransferase